jgi:hypothetical protein
MHFLSRATRTRSIPVWSVAALLVALALGTGTAHADMIFQPTPADMGDLDHHYIYEWGIDVPLAPGEQVAYAELSFDDIRNWDNNDNWLHVHLLDYAMLGMQTLSDSQGGGDYFAGVYAGTCTHLVTYQNLTTTPVDLTYVFTPPALVALNSYLADGRVGIGMDPDCHFFNNGITLRLVTVPEPATAALLVMGVLGGVLRKRA